MGDMDLDHLDAQPRGARGSIAEVVGDLIEILLARRLRKRPVLAMYNFRRSQCCPGITA